uniref:UphA n=1 Tax=Staphylococcus phage 184DA TaxID=3110532 RepID=A0AAU6MXU4_9CAUD
MASAKQLYYTESLVGKAIINNKVSNKEEVWDKLELLPETKLEELDNKQMSEVIKKLNQINE